jgi:uncharacterized membrane protein
MNEPWFNANAWAWLPGTLCGCLGGLWGTCTGLLAPRGKARGFVLGFGLLLIAVSAASLVAGLVAYRAGQPYGIWYGLGLPGVIGLCVMVPNYAVVLMRYRQAEERRMQAEDMMV